VAGYIPGPYTLNALTYLELELSYSNFLDATKRRCNYAKPPHWSVVPTIFCQ